MTALEIIIRLLLSIIVVSICVYQVRNLKDPMRDSYEKNGRIDL